MTRLLSTLALIGLVSASPALADDGGVAQVFDHAGIEAQGARMQTANPMTGAKARIAFDQADRSNSSAR